MGGKSIPGPHWVEVDLGRQCVVEKAVIDWEDGYSNSWTLKVFSLLKKGHVFSSTQLLRRVVRGMMLSDDECHSPLLTLISFKNNCSTWIKVIAAVLKDF
jgi:hypothetical protein